MLLSVTYKPKIMKTSVFIIVALLSVLPFVNQLPAQTSPDFDRAFEKQKQALDSTVNIFYDEITGQVLPVEKKEYTYGPDEHVTRLITYDWDMETQQWINDEKYEYQYNASGKLSTIISYWIDEDPLNWLIGGKEEYIYETGHETLTYYYWDAISSQWIYNKKYEKELDANGNVVEDVEYYYNSETSQWDPHVKNEYEFNSNNYLVEERNYYYMTNISDWLATSKVIYSYDMNNDLIEKAGYSYLTDLEEWRLGSKRKYTYNGNHQILSDTSLNWSWASEQLEYEDLTVYAYDGAGNKTEEVYSVWEDNQWLYDTKEVYVPNASGDLTELDIYTWFVELNDWVFAERIEVTLNTDYTTDQLILPLDYFTLDYPFKHMVVSTDGFLNDGNNNWIRTGSKVFYFSGYNPNSIIETAQNSVTLYPNPASSRIFLKSDEITEKVELELIDQQGKLVLSREVSANSYVQTDFLRSGVYLYRIKQNGNTSLGKLIIQR